MHSIHLAEITSAAAAAAATAATTTTTSRPTNRVDGQRTLLHDGVCGRQKTDVQHGFLRVEVVRAGRI